MKSRIVACFSLLILCLFTRISVAQGTYSPVTKENVVALKLNHYFAPKKQHFGANFEWKFTADEFLMKRGEAEIPADLRDRLLSKGAAADEIRGKWRLEEKGKDGLKLVLFEIVADGKAVAENAMHGVSFPIYKTAPTVMRIGEPQYVFGIGL